MSYFFGYTYEPGKNCFEVAVYGDTTDNTLTHMENLTEQIFAAITFDFTLQGDPQVDFFLHPIKKKIDLNMKIVAGGKRKKASQQELEKKLFGKKVFPRQIEVEVGSEKIMLVKMTIIPDVSINRALSALHVRGFLRRGYLPGKLYKGMYGKPKDPIINLFGLQSGQERAVRYDFNSGWYNKNGELLGSGDISTKDIVRIAQEIIPGEIFFINKEKYSRLESPGLGYVLKHASQVIVSHRVFHIVDVSVGDKEVKKKKINQIEFAVIDRHDLEKLIKEWLKPVK